MSDQSKSPRIDPHMLQHARDLRRDMTQPERTLWYRLRRRALDGYRFRRQHVIGPYVVDFCCPEAGVVIEVDGESHVGRGAEDARRTRCLESKGLKVIRVTNDDVLGSLDAVLEHILQVLRERAAEREE